MDNAHGGALAVALRDLHDIFGARLQAFVAYGEPEAVPARSLALVDSIAVEDLAACASRAASWHRAGCATPLLLTREEFAGSLDAFPIEYGAILDNHRVLFGAAPFAGLTIGEEDARRACEVQIKSLLLHLREDYIECRGHTADVAALVADSAPVFGHLLRRLAKLDAMACATTADVVNYASARPRLDPRLVGDVLALARDTSAAGIDAVKLYPDYLAAVASLRSFVDGWKATAE